MPAITTASLVALTQAAATDMSVGNKPLGSEIRADRVGPYAAALEGVRPTALLDTPLRLAHFMAQIAHETGSFGSLVESTRYTKAAGLLGVFPKRVRDLQQAQALVDAGAITIANFVYANRLGNGDTNSGDGYRYRGRGFLMITGKSNYAEVETYSGLPVVAQPDLLGGPTSAAEAAARFWATRNINAMSDKDDCDGVTLLVNGGMNGAPQRRAWLALAKSVWP